MIAGSVLTLLLTVAAPDAEADRIGSPYFLVEGTGRLPLRETSARATIAGVIARVQVTQVYQNEGADPIEATYVFPGSTRSAVFAMRMKIGERTVEAKIEKRDAARKLYQQALDDGRTASLLEQHRPNVFQMSVANIMPGDRVEVVLDYTELLRPQDGIYELVYPTVVGPRYVSAAEATAPAWNQNPYLEPGEKKEPYKWSASVRISAGMPISAVSSPSHTISPRFEGKNVVTVETDGEFGGNRDYVLRYRLDGQAIETGLLLYEGPGGKGEKYFLLLAQPPKRVAPSAYVPREYIFVVDVSGSMSGFPLETAKSLMRGLLGTLRSQDSFNILFFAGSNTVMAEKSVPATPENVQAALEMVENRRGGGGTEILGALKRAMALPRSPGSSTSIAVITDGYVTVEKETYTLVRKQLGAANLFAFGVGSSVNRAMIEAMARAGMGEPFFALNPTEAPFKAQDFQLYIESPLLTDAKLEVKGFDTYDVEPPSLPDVFASRPLVVFGKYRGTAEGTITLRGVDANGRFERTLRVQDAQVSDDLVALEYLWARDRIARISDDYALTEDAALEGEITALGLRHHLMTPFTSFVAVDSLIRNRTGGSTSIRQPLPSPAGAELGAKLGKRRMPPQSGLLGVLGATGGGGISSGGTSGGLSGDSIGGLGGLGARGHGNGGSGLGTGVGRAGRAINIQNGMPVVMGSLSKDVISGVIRKNTNTIQYCYEKSLTKNPQLQGKIVVRFIIDGSGKVSRVEIVETTIADLELESCVMERVKQMIFPKPTGGGSITVNYPFVFRSAAP